MFHRSAAVSYFPIGRFISTADGTEATTGTPAGTYTRDGTEGTLSGTIAYKSTAQEWGITGLTSDEMDGDAIGLNFTLAGCLPIHYTIETIPPTVDLTQAVPTSNTANTLGDCLNAARAQGFGKWAKSGTTLTLYAPNGTTVVRTFTLDDETSPSSRS